MLLHWTGRRPSCLLPCIHKHTHADVHTYKALLARYLLADSSTSRSLVRTGGKNEWVAEVMRREVEEEVEEVVEEEEEEEAEPNKRPYNIGYGSGISRLA
jgi:hypothetical protein